MNRSTKALLCGLALTLFGFAERSSATCGAPSCSSLQGTPCGTYGAYTSCALQSSGCAAQCFCSYFHVWECMADPIGP